MIGYVAIGAAIACALSFGSGWWYGGKGPRAELAAFRTQVEVLGERTELAWLTRLNAESKRAASARQRLATAEKSLAERAAGVRSGDGVHLPADVVGVWIHASDVANGAAAAEGGDRPAAPVSSSTQAQTFDERELATWFEQAALVHAACRVKLGRCIARYESVREGTLGLDEAFR